MATIVKETVLDAPAAEVWDALRDFAALHERLVPGFVVDCAMQADGSRRITFVNGAVAREVPVTIDEERRRLVYSVAESALGLVHHNASAQVFDDDRGSRFVWVTDMLPDANAGAVAAFMEQGLAAIRRRFATPVM